MKAILVGLMVMLLVAAILVPVLTATSTATAHAIPDAGASAGYATLRIAAEPTPTPRLIQPNSGGCPGQGC